MQNGIIDIMKKQKLTFDSRIDYALILPVFLLNLIGLLVLYIATNHDYPHRLAFVFLAFACTSTVSIPVFRQFIPGKEIFSMGTGARPPGSGAPRQKTHAPVFN